MSFNPSYEDRGPIAVRDSKDRQAAVLTFTLREWHAFLAGVRDGEGRAGEVLLVEPGFEDVP